MSDTPAANWYPDPANPALLRYGDGARWTDHTHDPNPQAVPAAATAEPAPRPAPVALTQPSRSPARGTTVAEPPSQARGGLFGSKKALETELEELRGFVAGFGSAERDALRQQLAQIRTELDAATAQRVEALAYNGEADVLVDKMRPCKLDAAVDRLDKSRATIVRLGATMHITITDEYHRLRIEELRLTADGTA